MEEKIRHCRKCLTSEMSELAYFENLHSYIRNLSPDIRCTKECYQNRLSKCKECERLIDGMCNACGCYVELRAAMEKKNCPYGKW